MMEGLCFYVFQIPGMRDPKLAHILVPFKKGFKKSISSGSWSKTQNNGQNRIYPSLTLLTAKFFPLKRVLKNL